MFSVVLKRALLICILKSQEICSIGGQAIIEGVMMRSPGRLAIAVRRKDGKIALKTSDIKIDKNKFFKLPIVRGLIGLYDAVVVGSGALNFSAVQSEEPFEEVVNKKGKKSKPLNPDSFFNKMLTILVFIVAFAIGIAGFIFAPLLLSELFFKLIGLSIYESFSTYFAFNIIDGIIRILFFVVYLMLISLMKDIRRIFMYHGAEHKAIFTYEKGEDLTVENTRKNSRFHPRCGTSFILIVLIVSILVFSIIPKDTYFVIKFLSRIVLIPVIAGISYEILKLSAKYSNNILVRIAVAPGLWLQKITTKEPTDDMIDVALLSIKASLEKNISDQEENIEHIVA